MTKREFIADLIQPLMLRARLVQDYETAIKYADLALQLNPKAIYSLVHKGAMYAQMVYETHERIKSENRSMTLGEKQQLDWYNQEAGKCIEKAFALGWKSETPEQQENYLKTVRDHKSRIEENEPNQN